MPLERHVRTVAGTAIARKLQKAQVLHRDPACFHRRRLEATGRRSHYLVEQARTTVTAQSRGPGMARAQPEPAVGRLWRHLSACSKEVKKSAALPGRSAGSIESAVRKNARMVSGSSELPRVLAATSAMVLSPENAAVRRNG